MEGTYDIPNKNPHFFVTTEPNRMGFSPKCRQLVICVIILKHIQVSSQFRELLMLKVRLSFLGDNLYMANEPRVQEHFVSTLYYECRIAVMTVVHPSECF